MEKTFAGALRNSRLAGFDRKLAQVYTASKNCKRTGEWGLKRSLPTVVRTPYITVSDLDTTEHQTPWQSGTSQVFFMRRWKENFPASKRPMNRSDQIQHNIASMTPGEFKQFVKRAHKRADDFQAKIDAKELVPDQVFEYVGATFHHERGRGHDLVGPTYSNHVVPNGYPVQGRILGSTEGGYAVGIGGVVAFLPKSSAVNLRRSSDRSLRTFYLHRAELDSEGRPLVTLRLHPPITAATIISQRESQSIASLSSPSSSSSPSGTTTSSTLITAKEDKRPRVDIDDMFLTSTEDDPNPNHQELMKMFSDLLNKK